MTMRAFAAIVSLAFAAPAWAFPGFSRRPAGGTKGVVTSPSQNAVLYALPSTTPPGCYASGATTLATDNTGAGVAFALSRAQVAYMADTANTTGWISCPANNLRFSGIWSAAIVDAAGTNLFTNTDSPSTSSGWSYIAAGPTATANSTDVKFLDGTNSLSKFAESAGVVSGLQESVTVTSQKYCMSVIFQYSGRACWGFSLDGTTTHAKFNIGTGSVTYTDPAATARITVLGNETSGAGIAQTWASACATLTAGSVTPQLWAVPDAGCANNTKAATGATSVSYFGRAMFQAAPTYAPTTYSAAGANRGQEIPSFPVTGVTADVCVSFKLQPYSSDLNAREVDPVSLYASATDSDNVYGAHNSLSMRVSAGGFLLDIYDNAGARKLVTAPATKFDMTVPHVVKGCTSSTGAAIVGVDGTLFTASTQPGTGILSASPVKLYVGAVGFQGQLSSTGAISDVVVCPTSDPNACGDWKRPEPKQGLALGDSITAGHGVTHPWTYTAATAAGVNIAQIARSGWTSTECKTAYAANRNRRASHVAVMCGTNDLTGDVFQNLKAIYEMIIADGAIPIPQTITPRGLNGQNEIDRQNINKAILRWCQDTGYKCADVATFVDNGSGSFNPSWSADNLHPNDAGNVVIGNFLAPFFQ